VELGGKPITINKRLNIKPDTFTAENSTYISGLMKKYAAGKKDGLEKSLVPRLHELFQYPPA